LPERRRRSRRFSRIKKVQYIYIRTIKSFQENAESASLQAAAEAIINGELMG
jgi:hypothetical protein